MNYDRLQEKYRIYLETSNYSALTIKRYMESVSIFLRYIEKEKGIRRVQDVTKREIVDYQTRVHQGTRKRDGEALSTSSKGVLITGVKSLFRYLVKRGHILYNPTADMEVPHRRKDVLRETLKEREITKLIESVKIDTPRDLRDRAILELLYSTGMRNAELRNLKVNHIDFETGEVKIYCGKGDKDRVVPLGSMARTYVERYLIEARPKLMIKEMNEYLFVSVRGLKLDRTNLVRIIKEQTQKAGIKKHVTPHVIRHTCATHILRNKADIRYVQELLGHESLDTTKLYTKLDIKDLKKVHKRSHPRERIWN